jgi:chitodextrinase
VEVTYDITAPAAPSQVIAESSAASVRVSWKANEDADLKDYMVVRAPKGTEEWDVIARELTATYFVDNTCRPGTSYIYKVKAVDLSQNISDASEVVEATPSGEPSLIARWTFEDNLYDVTPNMMDAAYASGVTAKYQADHKQGDKSLNLANQFAQLPYSIASSDELTIAMWVNWRSSTTQWQRLFDFGNDTEHYMFLTPYNSYTNVMRFAIKNGGDEQVLDAPTKLTAVQWKHVAVVLGKDKTSLYVDGEEVASTTGITIRPSDIRPVMNYLGRSQFLADPNLSAWLDDVRIYNYALTGDEVRAVIAEDPSGITDVKTELQNDAYFGLDGIRRDAPQRGINIINNKKVVR